MSATAALSEVVLYILDDTDLPTDNVSGPGGTEGRIAFTFNAPKIWRDDGTFWVDMDIGGSVFTLVRKLNSWADPDGPLDLNSQKIENLATPTTSTDAVTKGYADAGFSALSSGLTSSLQGYANGVGAAAQGYTDAREAAIRSDLAGGGGSGAAFSLVYTEDGEVVLLEDGTLATVRL